VTEQTPSGHHDLRRIIEAVKIFKIPIGVVINKHNINKMITNEISRELAQQAIPLLGKIEYDKRIVLLLNELKTPIDLEPDDCLRTSFEEISNKILRAIQE